MKGDTEERNGEGVREGERDESINIESNDSRNHSSLNVALQRLQTDPAGQSERSRSRSSKKEGETTIEKKDGCLYSLKEFREDDVAMKS